MLKYVLAAGLLSIAFVGQASADAPLRCTNHNLGMIHDETVKLNAPEQKHAMEMSMHELEMAMAAKEKHDYSACRKHIAMAAKEIHGK